MAKWSGPLLDSYLSGAWYLFWTDDVLYWVAKPNVFAETIASGRRLHRDDGPAVENDVENIYFWHGVFVPAYVVLCPEHITLGEIQAEKNAEVKRILIERWGWTRYLHAVGAKVLDTRRNDIEGTHESLLSTDESAVLVCACPSTARVYSLEVPKEITTCRDAQAWLSSGLSKRIVSAA